jgi:hypothetical protein
MRGEAHQTDTPELQAEVVIGKLISVVYPFCDGSWSCRVCLSYLLEMKLFPKAVDMDYCIVWQDKV